MLTTCMVRATCIVAFSVLPLLNVSVAAEPAETSQAPDDSEAGTAALKVGKQLLSARMSFQFHGTLGEAIRVFSQEARIPVHVPRDFVLPKLEGYVPPLNRSVAVAVTRATAEEVLSAMTSQARVGYQLDGARVRLVRRPIKEELPEETISQAIDELVRKRMEDSDFSFEFFGPFEEAQLIAIDRPFLTAVALSRYLLSSDQETQQTAITSTLHLYRAFWASQNLDKEIQEKTQKYLYGILAEVFNTKSEVYGGFLVETIGTVCGRVSIPLLKDIVKNERLGCFSAAIELARLRDVSGRAVLIEALEAGGPVGRLEAADALWRGLGDAIGLETVIRDMRVEQEDIGPYIVLLEDMGDVRAVPALIEQIKGPRGSQAYSALTRILGKEFPRSRFDPDQAGRDEAHKNCMALSVSKSDKAQ